MWIASTARSTLTIRSRSTEPFSHSDKATNYGKIVAHAAPYRAAAVLDKQLSWKGDLARPECEDCAAAWRLSATTSVLSELYIGP